MWSHAFDRRILSISSHRNKTAFGCEDGWIYLFDSCGLLWSKKLISTYYRGPFTDVNVLSVDVSDEFVVAGTDFADGKVHLFRLDGGRVWERQLMSYLGCWERPEDVKFVRIDDDRIAAVAGFMEDRLYIMGVDGEIESVEGLGTFIRCMDLGEIIALGGDDGSYVHDGKLRRLDFPSKDVVVVDDWAVFVKRDGIVSTLGWSFEAESPKVSASSKIVAVASGRRVWTFEADGGKVEEIVFEENVVDLRVVEDRLVVATEDRIYLNGDSIDLSNVFKLCDGGALIREGMVVRYLELW